VGVFGEKNIEKYEVCAAKASVFILAYWHIIGHR
jgi:hypothetical protein